MIIKNKGSKKLNIFPTPASSETTISLNSDYTNLSDWNIEIFTPNGKLKLKRGKLIVTDLEK
jgi:hypothetical protein